MVMSREQFQDFLDSHGADAARWPESERAKAERLIDSDVEARAMLDAARRLDALLARHTQVTQNNDDAVARVMKRLAPPLPRQKVPFWRWPTVLLDWEFSPAWPRVAALACCAALGFYIGIAGLDRPLDRLNHPSIMSRDIGSVVFEPEGLTGAGP
jgi:anti-sigma-K factor RskA